MDAKQFEMQQMTSLRGRGRSRKVAEKNNAADGKKRR